MPIIEEKKGALRDFKTAQNITSALRDISALKLKEIREEVKRGKTYYDEIEDMYRLIKYYATEKEIKLTHQERNNKIPKILTVAVTSNKRFYGSLNHDVMVSFLAYLEKAKNLKNEAHDFYIVGRTGREFIRGISIDKKVRFFEFRDDDPTAYETITFVDTTRQYDHVLMFYPKFVNVFKQEITVTDITYVSETRKTKPLEIEYIFEPELGEIFWFFDTQVRYILFNQTMLEIKLARLAARLVRMNVSEQNARAAVRATQLEIRKTVALLNNMKLLETFSGMKQWRKKGA